MDSADTRCTSPRPLPWWWLLSVGALLALLTFWTWQKWDTVWIERSEGFFPPEWQQEDLDTLAWEYPIYRSNDSYQWVHVADALGAGDRSLLSHRLDEGLPEGRPNRWHSGLAYLLSSTGTLTAQLHDWPQARGIHHAAHWLGSVIHIFAILLGAYLLSRLSGKHAGLLFAGFCFFNAAINWDFAFSRLDHESVFQIFFILHLLGLAGLCIAQGTTQQRNCWALLAGISAGFCWWISATTMIALSVLTTLGISIECYRARKMPYKSELVKAVLLWGASAAAMICLFSLIDGRLNLSPSIATIHPIFILAQLGAACFCLAVLQTTKAQQLLTLSVSLPLSLSPILWLFIYQTEAHPWLNPMMRRMHDYIVEFQSPYSNGLWTHASNLQAIAIAALALFALRALTRSRNSLFACLIIGLLLLATLQTRWLGLLATASTIGLCLQLQRDNMTTLKYLCYGLLLLFSAIWTQQWKSIEKDPGTIFITDLMLQVGARDINLNLQRLSEGETIHVAMPYAFAATSALFPEVHPLGTFYWENTQGIHASSNFFTGLKAESRIDYAVVQGGRQGAPFARLVNWIAMEDITPAKIETSLAWQLSTRQSSEGWIEKPYHGTFGTDQFSVRIYQMAP